MKKRKSFSSILREVIKLRKLFTPTLRKKLKVLATIIIPFLLILVVVPLIDMEISNESYFGRKTEIKKVNHPYPPFEKNRDYPTVRLILHKLLIEENAIEASLIVYGNRDLLKTNFHVILRNDGSDRSLGIQYEISNKDSMQFNIDGIWTKSFKSDRFIIPTFHSISGFPYDKIMFIPMVSFHTGLPNGSVSEFNFEVQKSISGRVIEINSTKGAYSWIELERTRVEKIFVIVSSLIFLLISSLIGYGLITAKMGISNLEELFMVAGYLIATVGFRELIGLSRISGISALEIVVIGFPLLLIFIAIVFSFIKGYWKSK